MRQLSPLFDAPQYAEQFMELACKTLRCRDLKIRAKAVLTDVKGKPILNPKPRCRRSALRIGRRCKERRRHNLHLINLREIALATWQNRYEEAG